MYMLLYLLNSSPIDELGKLVPGKSVGGLTRLRHSERYPWQPCKWEPSQQAAPLGTVTLKNSVEQTILTWNLLAKRRVSVVGQESATIHCTVNDPRRRAKLQAKYIAQHDSTLPRPIDHPKDHVLPRNRPLPALAQA